MQLCPKCQGVMRRRGFIKAGRTHAKQNWRCRSCEHQTVNPIVVEDKKLTSKRYIITSAQNNTAVCEPFVKALEVYAKHNKAEIIVMPFKYRNPTSLEESAEQEETIWWSPRIVDYVVRGRLNLNNNLVLAADISIQPTAQRPMQGLESITGKRSGIFGHVKHELRCVATKGQELPKIMASTGCCTKKNYSDSKAGKKGEFHHITGALVVDVEGDFFFMRQINANQKGEFYDLDKLYSPDGVKVKQSVDTIALGDIHAEMVDRDALDASKDMIKTLKPKNVILHDVLNFGSAGHHNDYFERFRRHSTGTNSVERELQETFKVLDEIGGTGNHKMVMVNSNHHDHFMKWLENHNNAHDLENAIIYHKTKTAMLEAIRDGVTADPFKFWASKMQKTFKQVKWLEPGESFSIRGVEYQYHGHQGANGARGSSIGFDKIGVKTVTGHSHTPAITGGNYTVGTTSKLNMGYNIGGPSSWIHCQLIQYRNGKRSLNFIIGDKWRFA